MPSPTARPELLRHVPCISKPMAHCWCCIFDIHASMPRNYVWALCVPRQLARVRLGGHTGVDELLSIDRDFRKAGVAIEISSRPRYCMLPFQRCVILMDGSRFSTSSRWLETNALTQKFSTPFVHIYIDLLLHIYIYPFILA